MGKLLALITIGLNVCACVGYFYDGDWRRCLYWGAAAVLTSSVTF